jgi:hypothetical protein
VVVEVGDECSSRGVARVEGVVGMCEPRMSEGVVEIQARAGNAPSFIAGGGRSDFFEGPSQAMGGACRRSPARAQHSCRFLVCFEPPILSLRKRHRACRNGQRTKVGRHPARSDRRRRRRRTKKQRRGQSPEMQSKNVADAEENAR